MPPSDPRIDLRLKAFLDDKDEEKANGYTVANLFLEIKQVSIVVDEMNSELRLLKSRVDRHGRNIAAIKQQIDMDSDSSMDSGLHVVEDLKKQLAKKEEEHQWWRRSAVKWIVGGIAWIATTIAATLVSSIWSHK